MWAGSSDAIFPPVPRAIFNVEKKSIAALPAAAVVRGFEVACREWGLQVMRSGDGVRPPLRADRWKHSSFIAREERVTE